MTPKYWQQATLELATQDKIMHQLINYSSTAKLNSRNDAFTTLARAIVGQQISVKSANTIWQKIFFTFPQINPSTIYVAEPNILRTCGLSIRKISYLQDLSLHFLNSKLNETHWAKMSDKELIAQLTQVKGIGRWTAEMFLIFHMLRADILPLNDIGLQRAISMHYNANQPVDKKFITTTAQPWRPWRSVATWYLWQSLDKPLQNN